jgi:sensor histidine kinase YesM
LNAIISISRKDPDRSRKLLVEFSHYLRNSFDFKDLDQKIPIEQEINLIRSYAVLERARFKDKIAFNFELDDISFRIPPLLLQPLVENAVIHGLRPKSGPGEITVYIKKEGAHALLGVKDDGVGMPEAVMHKIKNQQTIVSNSEGIGLQNIAQRLRNIYGATLQVTSTAGAGSEVFMLIPMQGVK